MHTITDKVSITSVLNPNMRMFDVVMCTEYGSSYNSYVVAGTDKTALIDANHATFASEWLEKVAEALDGRKPDYLVLNHTEPDHSGAVAACLKRYPEIVLVCSAAAAINIKEITNLSALEPQVVKDGDSLDLGELTLRFISAPFLHWPDTMFTWIPEQKLLFSCDFLGAHFCEPRLFDHRIVFARDYTTAFKEYYDAIMAPFGPWVAKGLDKLEALDPEVVAPSHGPILTKRGRLATGIEHYRAWSAPPAADAPRKISLFYCSAYGNTKKLAASIATGIRNALPDAQVCAHDLVDANVNCMGAELNSSDAFLLGSPTLNRDAVPPVWNLVAEIDAVNIAKRPVAFFGSYGWSGEALPALSERLATLKAAVYEPQFRVRFVPSEDDLVAAEEFGAGFARGLVAGAS
ncbi:MAG: FprA family A-type flavoprotein [Coriobacteriales bacterium]|jgi:flavorubredoxin|nr:FprA family A-type flavoprotein [Coriobacteriales bacterium]